MPCNLYSKCDSIIPEEPPPATYDSPPLKSNEMINTYKTLPTKPGVGSEMAVKQPSKESQTVEKASKLAGNMKNGSDENQKPQATTSKKSKPRSFSLLEMSYKDKEGKGHGRLVRQRSVKFSYEKETHKLSHAASAPAAISEALESQVEDEVFTEEKEKKDDNKTLESGNNSSYAPADVDSSGKKTEKEGGTEDADEKTEPVVEDERKATERVAEDAEKREKEKSALVEEVGEEAKMPGKAEEEKVSKDANEKSKTEGGTSLVQMLTQDLQTALRLEDGGEKDKTEVKAEGEVSALADDLQQSLSLEGKDDKEAVCKMAEGGGVGTSEKGQPRLRAKGIHREDAFGQPNVILSTNNTFNQHCQQGQWIASQPALSSPNWHIGAQPQNQPLPPLSVFLRPPMKPSGQPSQSVVCPPGQSNLTRMVYMGPSRSQMLTVSNQSMQQQYAQKNLCHNTSMQQLQTSYPQNCLHSGGPTVPMTQPQPMNIPNQSTGNPKEDDWPPTPEAHDNDILDRSPVENEEPMAFQVGNLGIDLMGTPSPQSSWDGSQAPSLASTSPVPSPYTPDIQQLSPAPLVPDVNSPWSPESNISSTGEPPSPCGSTIIKVTDNMTFGMVTVSPVSPHSAKRQRNDSSTDSLEAQERISGIKKYLQTGTPDSSPTYQTQMMSPPQVPSYCPSLTPPYTPAPAPEIPPQAFRMPYTGVNQPFPTTCTPHQVPPTPHRTYQQSDTPPEGELEAFRKQLAEWSVEELLMPDEDMDTVLHLAICQTKVALSLAIIERICNCKQKVCLNVKNKLQQTPLYLSVISNLPILTQILINYGADLFIRNRHGNTPLHAAARNGNTEAIKAICEGMSYCGYSEETTRDLFDTINYDGKSALMLAVENHGNMTLEGEFINCHETVCLLLQSFGSALQQDSNSGKTALHYAVELHKIDLILDLLDNCEDAGRLVNSQMYDGNTALHLIVGRDRPEHEILEIVNLLMTHGANVGLENAAREKPHDLLHREHVEIKRRLHGQGNRKR
ncbi:uncharacterized protein LOC110989336 isoform X2 [Acanthaster planci]|nr:uncharacterized protein LOC110989336 isoform X2 [Acanthaster planci]